MDGPPPVQFLVRAPYVSPYSGRNRTLHGVAPSPLGSQSHTECYPQPLSFGFPQVLPSPASLLARPTFGPSLPYTPPRHVPRLHDTKPPPGPGHPVSIALASSSVAAGAAPPHESHGPAQPTAPMHHSAPAPQPQHPRLVFPSPGPTPMAGPAPPPAPTAVSMPPRLVVPRPRRPGADLTQKTPSSAVRQPTSGNDDDGPARASKRSRTGCARMSALDELALVATYVANGYSADSIVNSLPHHTALTPSASTATPRASELNQTGPSVPTLEGIAPPHTAVTAAATAAAQPAAQPATATDVKGEVFYLAQICPMPRVYQAGGQQRSRKLRHLLPACSGIEEFGPSGR